MPANKSERLLNLLIMLLVQRRYVAKSRIRELLYPDQSGEAFEKMFERDKEELRSIGVPVEVGQQDLYFDDEPGYRVPPDQFALPEISLATDEAAVIGVAAKVWEHAKLAETSSEALRKLAAGGVEIDPEALDIAQPRLVADESSFEVFWQAVHHRTPIVFEYARAGQPSRTRRLEPWGVVRYAGRWYTVGRDVDQDQERIFRLSRVIGEPRVDGASGAYEVPDGTDIGKLARRLAPAPSPVAGELLVRVNTCHALRRQARSVESGVTGPDQRTSWDRLTLAQVDPAEVLECAADAFVISPAELRHEVLGRLSAALAAI
jgi:proteasome accessory factor B